MLENLIVAGHVSTIYGPVQALVEHLRARRADFRFISLPFSYSGMASAESVSYRKGREIGRLRGHASRGPDPLLWVRDFLYVLRRGWGPGRSPLFIGIDNLNAAAGILLR